MWSHRWKDEKEHLQTCCHIWIILFDNTHYSVTDQFVQCNRDLGKKGAKTKNKKCHFYYQSASLLQNNDCINHNNEDSCRDYVVQKHTYMGKQLTQENSLWTGHSGCPSWTEPLSPPFLWRVFCYRRWHWRKTFSLPFCSQSDGEFFSVNKGQTHTRALIHTRCKCSPLCGVWPPGFWLQWPWISGVCGVPPCCESPAASDSAAESPELALACRLLAIDRKCKNDRAEVEKSSSCVPAVTKASTTITG